MDLIARYSGRQNSWYVADMAGDVEIETALYDTQDDAEADFDHYRDLYAQ